MKISCFSVPNEDSTKTQNKSIHYSQLYFTEPIMIPGNNPMPYYLISSNEKKEFILQITPYGNLGNGAIRITIIKRKIITCEKRSNFINLMYLVYIFIVLKR